MAATVALTFDDGPNPDVTPRLLELLDAHGAAATFFIWGERAEQDPELVAAIAAAGHSVQPHCYEHRSHWELAPGQIEADLERIVSLLRELAVAAPRLWRPPYGKLHPGGATRAVAARHRVELAGWSIDPEDWAGHPAAEMHPQIERALTEQDEAVVLLHDGHREPGSARRRADAGNTFELVRLLLDRTEARFVSLESGFMGSLREPASAAS